jgi:hypothetical protein
MARKKQQKAPPKPRRTPDPSVKYIRDTCTTLEGAADREAVQLLIGGVLFTEPGDCLDDAVARLWETDTYRRKSAVLDTRSERIPWTPEQEKLLHDLEDFQLAEQMAAVNAAYLLGIAVGRRLGPRALTFPGGAR